MTLNWQVCLATFLCLKMLGGMYTCSVVILDCTQPHMTSITAYSTWCTFHDNVCYAEYSQPEHRKLI